MRGQNDHPRNSKHNTTVVVVRVSFTYRILRTAYVVVTSTEFTLWGVFITKTELYLSLSSTPTGYGAQVGINFSFHLMRLQPMRVKLNNWGKK